MSSNGKATSGTESILAHAARDLGREAFEQVKDRADQVVAWEKTKRQTENQAEIVALKARGMQLVERHDELKEILRHTPPDDLVSLRRRRIYYRLVAVILISAGVFLAYLALAPFGLGWEVCGFVVGAGLVGGFLTDRTLERIKSENWIKAICISALVASLVGLFILALLRGDILVFYLKSTIATSATGETPDAGALANSFYNHAIIKLQIFMGLLAVAMELGSGLALYESRKFDLTSHERAVKAREELCVVQQEMIVTLQRVTFLENEPAIHEAAFYRNFYLGMLERLKKNVLLPVAFISIFPFQLLSGSAAHAQNGSSADPRDAPNVVIAIDFTQSVAGKGYDGKTDYEKNIDGACRLISQLPPGTHLAVVAITDRSFSQPYLLLERGIPRDKGPLQFQDRIAIARAQVATELRRASESSPPKFPHTDIVGALIVSADILRQSSGRKVLVLFSDMRQSTRELDLERPDTITVVQALGIADQRRLVADLHGIEVYVLGVDALGKTVGYWHSLRDFWAAYFKKAGAFLKVYSILRNSPDLSQLK